MAERWGSFELLERVARDDASETWIARDTAGTHQRIRVERLLPELLDDESVAGQFDADVTQARALVHPNVLPIIDHGQVNGVPFLVQPEVPAKSLRALIDASRASGSESRWPLSSERAAAVVVPIFDALIAAEALQPPLLHRDLEPEDVLISADGELRVTRFGLGRLRHRAGLRRPYLSVEQARGQRHDARSETFTVGLMLFELCCGRLPFEGTPGEQISKLASGELDTPLGVRPGLEPAMAAVLTQALALEPEKRFADAAAMRRALEPSLPADPVESRARWVSSTTTGSALPAVSPIAPVNSPPLPVVSPAVAMRKPPAGWRRAVVVMLAFGLGSGVASLIRANRTAPPVGPEVTIVSQPADAEVWVDNKLVGKGTPVHLALTANALHQLQLKSGAHKWTGTLQNTKFIRVDLIRNQVDQTYYGAGPAAPPSTPVARPVELPSRERAVEARHRFDTLPAHFTLESADAFLQDRQPGADAHAHDRWSLDPTAHLGSPKSSVFVLEGVGADQKLIDLDSGWSSPVDTRIHLVVIRHDESAPALIAIHPANGDSDKLLIGGPRRATDLGWARPEHSYEVTDLMPANPGAREAPVLKPVCVVTTALDQALPFPPVVMTVDRTVPSSLQWAFSSPDSPGIERKAQVVLAPGVRSVERASRLFFDMPVLGGATFSRVEVTVRWCD